MPKTKNQHDDITKFEYQGQKIYRKLPQIVDMENLTKGIIFFTFISCNHDKVESLENKIEDINHELFICNKSYADLEKSDSLKDIELFHLSEEIRHLKKQIKQEYYGGASSDKPIEFKKIKISYDKNYNIVIKFWVKNNTNKTINNIYAFVRTKYVGNSAYMNPIDEAFNNPFDIDGVIKPNTEIGFTYTYADKSKEFVLLNWYRMHFTDGTILENRL